MASAIPPPRAVLTRDDRVGTPSMAREGSRRRNGSSLLQEQPMGRPVRGRCGRLFVMGDVRAQNPRIQRRAAQLPLGNSCRPRVRRVAVRLRMVKGITTPVLSGPP
jgi:hypothetical protein